MTESTPPNKRARRFTPGAYPTHVYLSVECVDRQSHTQVLQILRDHRARLPAASTTLEWTELDLQSSLHISLCRSAPVDVQYCATLEAKLRELARTLWTADSDSDSVAQCTVSTWASKYLLNADGDRAFLTLLVDQDTTSGRRVRDWIANVDRIFAQFGLAPYHENPLPHVSIAYTNELPKNKPDDEDADDDEDEDGSALSSLVTFRITSLTIVSGAQVTKITPPPKQNQR
jgi:hypothetical protein